MTIDRRYNQIVFVCDTCDAEHEARTNEFNAAFGTAKAEGWRAIKVDGEWEHRCPDCRR